MDNREYKHLRQEDVIKDELKEKVQLEKKAEKGKLREQIQQSLSKLAEAEAAAAHDHKRQPGHGILTVAEGLKP